MSEDRTIPEPGFGFCPRCGGEGYASGDCVAFMHTFACPGIPRVPLRTIPERPAAQRWWEYNPAQTVTEAVPDDDDEQRLSWRTV